MNKNIFSLSLITLLSLPLRAAITTEPSAPAKTMVAAEVRSQIGHILSPNTLTLTGFGSQLALILAAPELTRGQQAASQVILASLRDGLSYPIAASLGENCAQEVHLLLGRFADLSAKATPTERETFASTLTNLQGRLPALDLTGLTPEEMQTSWSKFFDVGSSAGGLAVSASPSDSRTSKSDAHLSPRHRGIQPPRLNRSLEMPAATPARAWDWRTVLDLKVLTADPVKTFGMLLAALIPVIGAVSVGSLAHPAVMAWCLGVAVVHAWQEGRGGLAHYFGVVHKNNFLKLLDPILGFLFIVLPALALQGAAAWFALTTGSSFALSVIIGARIGDAIFSHFWPALRGFLPNPGLSTARIYLADGLVLLFAALHFHELALLGLLAGAGFFAILGPIFKLTGTRTKDAVD